MNALDRIREIESMVERKAYPAYKSHADRDFLLRAFQTMRQIAAINYSMRTRPAINGLVPVTPMETFAVDKEFEEAMARESAPK